jgi:transposase
MLPDQRAWVQTRPGMGMIGDGRNADHGGWPMSVPRVRPVRLTATQRHRLKKIARGHKRPHRDRLRALIVLGAAGGRAGAAIARRCRVTPDTARKWRGRFATDALDGLRDRKRCAAPVHPVQQAQAKALACELPAASGVPLSRWSAAEVADEAVTAGLVDAISGATVPPMVVDLLWSGIGAGLVDIQHSSSKACQQQDQARAEHHDHHAMVGVVQLRVGPAASGVPLSRWSAAEVADEAVTAGLVDAIGGATVPRWLRADALKPWQYRSWVTLWAPDFAARAAVALDPYAGSYDLEPLGDGNLSSIR